MSSRTPRVATARRAAGGEPGRGGERGPTVVRGSLDGSGLRIAILVSRFNERIGQKLLEGALRALERRGVRPRDVLVAHVPGAFELPVVARRLARTGRHDAILCLGAVIRGDTPHFDYVAGAAARGIERASYDTGVPVLFGVLTTENLDQALARAGGAHGNKGAEAAEGAIEMARLLRALGGRGAR